MLPALHAGAVAVVALADPDHCAGRVDRAIGLQRLQQPERVKLESFGGAAVGAAAGIALDTLIHHRAMTDDEFQFADAVFQGTLPRDRIVLKAAWLRRWPRNRNSDEYGGINMQGYQ